MERQEMMSYRNIEISDKWKDSHIEILKFQINGKKEMMS